MGGGGQAKRPLEERQKNHTAPGDPQRGMEVLLRTPVKGASRSSRGGGGGAFYLNQPRKNKITEKKPRRGHIKKGGVLSGTALSYPFWGGIHSQENTRMKSTVQILKLGRKGKLTNFTEYKNMVV